MILDLYFMLILLSMILIIMGFIWRDHTELSIIGFLFLFLLALSLSGGSVEYKTGSNLTAIMNYNPAGDVDNITQTISYNYANFNEDTSQRFGRYLAIASFLGFVITIATLGFTKWRDRN